MKRIFNKFWRKDSSQPQPKKVLPPIEPERLGLKLIYEHENPTIDIIVIHGHGGHWKESWVYKQEDGTETFWLLDLLPEILPQARVLSFGYDASDALASPLDDIASKFLHEIIQVKGKTETKHRPLIFIAHSFGGMLLKGVLGTCVGIWPGQVLGDLRSATYGIIFLGVPRNAKDSFGTLGNSMMGTDDLADTPLIAALKRDVHWLEDQTESYDQISDEFAVTYFVESDGMSVKSQVSPEDTQKKQEIGLNRTHGMMTRYPSADDDDFKKIAACLINMVEHAPETCEAKEWFFRE